MFKIIIHIVYQFFLVNTYLYIFRLVSNFTNIATIVVSRFELIKFQNVSYNSYNVFITFPVVNIQISLQIAVCTIYV